MDRLEALGNQLSQITFYDIKSAYNQAKNMVLNVSEMEAKVREATNDEPWGASSTLMQEIAQGTFNFQHFNEIMPCIYARFMEKEARQWREIYKALQLLEYLVKNGSERVVDDARSHISTIKMLRNFHYIDDKGKDQGLNVRNRSRELSELLVDVEKIRTERRKAKANRAKYVGTGNNGMSFGGSGRYDGFGGDSISGGSYSGGYSGQYDRGLDDISRGFSDDAGGRKGYDEYDAGDYETPRRSNSLRTGSSSVGRQGISSTQRQTVKEAPKAGTKEVDLLGFNDDEGVSGNNVDTSNKTLPSAKDANFLDNEDDDFSDFQVATPASGLVNTPVVNNAKVDLFDLLGSGTSVISSNNTAQSPVQQPATLNQIRTPTLSTNSTRQSFTGNIPSAQVMGASRSTPASPPARTNTSSAFGTNATQGHTNKSSTSNFDDLWNLSLGSTAKANQNPTSQKSINDIAKEKANANIWGASGNTLGQSSFAGNNTPQSSQQSGIDDLLL